MSAVTGPRLPRAAVLVCPARAPKPRRPRTRFSAAPHLPKDQHHADDLWCGEADRHDPSRDQPRDDEVERDDRSPLPDQPRRVIWRCWTDDTAHDPTRHDGFVQLAGAGS